MKDIFYFGCFGILFYKTSTYSIYSNLYLYFFTFLIKNLPLPRYCTRSIKKSLRYFWFSSDFLKLLFLTSLTKQLRNNLYMPCALSHVNIAVDFISNSWWCVCVYLLIFPKHIMLNYWTVDTLFSFKLFLTEKKNSKPVYPNAKHIFRYFSFTWKAIVKYVLIICAMVLQP